MLTPYASPTARSLPRLLAVSLLLTTPLVSGLPSLTYVGCFSSSQPLTDQGPWTYQTQGYCQPICIKQNQAVLGLSGGSNCWCGDQLPAANSKVDDSNCDTPCDGYSTDFCGGTNFWTVYLTGLESSVSNDNSPGSSDTGSTVSAPTSTPASVASTSSSESSAANPATNSPATTAAPIVVTSVRPGQTIVVTEPAQQNAANSSSTASASSSSNHGSKTNVGGIAAGVVVGILALVAIIAGLVFWQRHRRRKAAEDEYHRSTQVNEFMRAGSRTSPPTAYSNISDSRLDPEAGGRRNSQGSIADAQDHSRRILRVANPDG